MKIEVVCLLAAMCGVAWPTHASAAPEPAPAPEAEPEAEVPTSEPEPEPEPEASTPEPEPEAEDPTPEPEARTPEPEPEARTPEPEARTPEPEPEARTPETEPGEVVIDGVRYRPAPGAGEPPYADEADIDALRKRYGLPTLAAADRPELHRRVAWRCLIADPLCGTNIEVNATTAYAYRLRQGNVRNTGLERWHSSRVQYDLWVNLPVAVENRGNLRVTRITLGPKGGVAFSDNGEAWGNVGMAMRAWLGYGKYAPTIELTSALSMGLTRQARGRERIDMTRRPVGVSLDVGVGLGGFGAIVFGGQIEPPLARAEVPESLRTLASGMFYIGFRGNILWGAPAATAVTTHALTQRYVGR